MALKKKAEEANPLNNSLEAQGVLGKGGLCLVCVFLFVVRFWSPPPPPLFFLPFFLSLSFYFFVPFRVHSCWSRVFVKLISRDLKRYFFFESDCG